uniref:3'-5' exonuclease domain-containing protein n=1 Tax=Chenopodium quinoa TaxID=63459 RepID=A0A803MUQ7_CHEQI
MENTYPKALTIHWVSTTDSPEFTLLNWALTHSSLVALDAEWKPVRTQTTQPTDSNQDRTFPTVSLLQLACRLVQFPPDSSGLTQLNHQDDSVVFLVDLQSLPFGSIYEELKQMFVDQNVLKLGFRFKQDLVYLSSTFCSNGFEPGFDLELQCSDWSQRPLTEEQKIYSAIDAHCLLEIFSIFQLKVDKEENFASDVDVLGLPSLSLGLKEVLERPTACERIVRSRVGEASSIVGATTATEFFKSEISMDTVVSDTLSRQTIPFDKSLSRIVSNYGSKILLNETDRKPKTSKKKGKKQPKSSLNGKHRGADDDWQGPPPWESLNGGDGYPKFLCDVMIEGLAKHLRCVGIDAATPYSKKPESRELIEQAQKEKRVILTRDAKLLRHDYLLENQIYRVKSLLKNEQLLEVIQTFQLKISEDRLMSRCTKCNGRFIQKPLSTEEAVEAAKGFQKIPNCLFNKNLEFWQCMDCNQLYWEGTQYHNAVQKFVNICSLNE